MKKTIRTAAFAALLVPAILFADSANVIFNVALTNETGWAYSDVATSNDGNIYFKLSSSVQSPTFSFSITSIEITLSCTSTAPSRYLKITPSSGVAKNAAPVAKASTKETQLFEFSKTDAIRSFSLTLDGSDKTGNWYIYSAVISGVPLIEAPTDLQTNNVTMTRCRLSWVNPENSVSNKIEVSEVIEIEFDGESILEYDFNSFMNSSRSSKDITDDFTNAIPAFAGSSLIRLPANTNGIIQISKNDTKGYLVHSGFADCSDMSIVLSLRIPTSDHGKTFGVGYLTSEGTTNEFATFSMDVVFQTNTVSLANVPANASIILNTQGTGSRRVVYVDYLAFVNGSRPASVSTNLVKTAFAKNSTTYRVRDLSPLTEYVAAVTAFDADGNESAPSEPIQFMTAGQETPFVVRLQ